VSADRKKADPWAWAHLTDMCHDGCGVGESEIYTPVARLSTSLFLYCCEAGHTWTCSWDLERAQQVGYYDCPCPKCRRAVRAAAPAAPRGDMW
jgi:hypothetical protein